MGITTFTSTITDDALGHVIHQLSTLYSDPVTAVLREYVTNGLDAHMDAKTARPVQVRLPSHENPTLSVRDFGDGLDVAGLQAVFFNYGSSTKRLTNGRIGSLGFGAKSAFSVTNSWRVRSIHQGKLYHVSSTKSMDGLPVQRVLIDGKDVDQSVRSDATDNGIEIQIDVDLHKFSPAMWDSKLSDIGLWLPAGSIERVVQDDDGPHAVEVPTWEHATEILPAPFGTGKLLLDGRNDPSPFVVMGGVSYRLNPSFQRSVMDHVWSVLPSYSGALDQSILMGAFGVSRDGFMKLMYGNTVIYGFGVRVPMGSVPFAPNREEIIATPEAVALVGEILAQEIESISVELAQLAQLPPQTRLWEVARFMSTMRVQNVRWLLDTTGIPTNTNLSVGTNRPKDPHDIKTVSLTEFLSSSIPKMGSPYNTGAKSHFLITGNDRQRIPFAEAFQTHHAKDGRQRLTVVHTLNKQSTGNEFLDHAMGLVFPLNGPSSVLAALNDPASTGVPARVYTYAQYLDEVREIRNAARENGEIPARRDDTMWVLDYSIPGMPSEQKMSYTQIAALSRTAEVPVYFSRSEHPSDNSLVLPDGVDYPESLVVLLGKRRKIPTLNKVLSAKEVGPVLPLSEFYTAASELVSDWLRTVVDSKDADALSYYLMARFGHGFSEVERSLALLGQGILDSPHHAILDEGHPVLDAALRMRRGMQVWADLASTLPANVPRSVSTLVCSKLNMDPAPWVDKFPLAMNHNRLVSSTDDPKEKSRILEHFALYLAVTG